MNGSLVLQAWALYERGKLMDLVDDSLKNELDVEEACRLLKVGLLCTQDSMKLRPSMSAVLRMLYGETDVHSEKITKPGVVNDIMDLKVMNSNKADPVDRSSST